MIEERVRAIFILMTCFFSVVSNAKENPFSLDRLKEFYNGFFCEQKQELFLADLTAPCPRSFWVSTQGSDSNPGTEQAPFRTLQRARDAVRALGAEWFEYDDVVVYIEEGTYRLEQPLELSGMDSGRNNHDVVYSASPGAHPVISGAIEVTDWSLYYAPLGIYRASVGSHTSRQLYVNGNRATRAQTTSNPAGFLPSWTAGGIEFIPTTLNPEAWRDASTWKNPQDIEAVLVTQWKMMRVPFESITPYSFPTNGLITLQQPAWNNANVYWDKDTMAPGEWSFWEVTRFENAYEFLTQPGQWYLDKTEGWLYYIPLSGEDINQADVELPILETLIDGQGTQELPIHHIRFEGLTFSYATWLSPSSNQGYVSDQSGQLLLGSDHQYNIIGHDQHVVPTPANLSFVFASQIVFYGNIFEHLGGAALYFGSGSLQNIVKSNLFTDISSSAIILGAVTQSDSHPTHPGYVLDSNLITNNLIRSVAKEYVDAAGIFIGFTSRTTISHNTIVDVPWAGIAMGWGWGLLDVGSFPGLPHATSGMWGTYTTPTPNNNSAILQNRIDDFLNVLWDGGAIYTTGQQGPSLPAGLLMMGNVATGKRASGGGNTFYTDGGSRYIQVYSNASYDNPIGVTFYGPPPQIGDPFYFQYPLYYLQNDLPYGSDSGGCVTYGDIDFSDNYWLEAPIPANIVTYNAFYFALLHFYPYSEKGFFNICPYSSEGISYPINLSYQNNHLIASKGDIPNFILSQAGVQSRPSTIPEDRWQLPPD